jgi:hypothetical protein
MDWLTPTRRLVRCSLTFAAAAFALAVLAVVRIVDQGLPIGLYVAALAMVVISGLAGLHDPGRNLLHALPVSAARRLLHRLVVIVPVVVLGLLAVRRLASELFPRAEPSPGWAALAALGTVGVAVCTALTRRMQARAADVTVSAMLGWVVAGITMSSRDAPLGLAMPWWRWPALVLLTATVFTVVSTTRGTEA